jgi:hypothetical protein
VECLRRQTLSRLIPTQQQRLLQGIRFYLGLPQPPAAGEWITTDIRGTIYMIFYIMEIHEGWYKGYKYSRLPTEMLKLDSEDTHFTPPQQLEQVRVVTTTGIKK